MTGEEQIFVNKKPNRMMLRRTLFLLVMCAIVAFSVIGARLFKLQIIDHDLYESKAIDQQLRSTTITAHRGTILDRNGRTLAMSATADTIYISPVEIAIYNEDKELIAKGLSEILGVSYEGILEKANDRSSWYKTISVKVEQDIADRVRQFKVDNKLVGVKIETDTKRYYPGSALAAHSIGFVGTDNTGLSGVEAYYNTLLTGINGQVVRAKSSAGTDMLFTNFEDYRDAVSGNDLVLTVDSGLQYFLEKHLKQAVIDYDVQNGAGGIIMNVKTGEILAMASLGDFDLNNYQAIDDESMKEILGESNTDTRKQMLSSLQQLQWRNKPLSDTYEPGSVFKIITLSMALEEGVVSEKDTFYCGGRVPVLGRNSPVKCWKSGGHGSQTLIQALQHSCNVAFVNVGMRVGAENFYKYAKAFGLFDKTGLDLYGESGSIWWDDSIFINKDNLSQLAAASFGQTFNITPLQLIRAVGACVNGGNLMKPYILKEVHDPSGNVVSVTEPQVVRQVISEQTSAKVRNALEQVVGDKKEGTGRNASVAGYRIGGKTGTSEKVAQDVAGGEKEYIVSFLGIAPADNPEIAILVLLDTPSNKTGIYISGGQMAAPTVGKILADALPYLGVDPVYTEDELAKTNRTVPDLYGQSVPDAESELKKLELSVRMVGEGAVVTDQLPKPGSVIAPGSSVIIYAGQAANTESTVVPDLSGMSFDEAEAFLSQNGLFIRRGSAGAAQGGTVTTQSISDGTKIARGTVIEVTLVDLSELGRY